MKRTTTIRIMLTVALAVCVNMAEAQWTQYRGANGSSWGSANRMGNTTYYNNANGTSAGRSTTMGNTTYHYNANGTSAGRGTTMGGGKVHDDGQHDLLLRAEWCAGWLCHPNRLVIRD